MRKTSGDCGYGQTIERRPRSELGHQYSDRVNSDAQTWTTLPASTQDVSLRAVSQAVLHSYPGVEGGYYADS